MRSIVRYITTFSPFLLLLFSATGCGLGIFSSNEISYKIQSINSIPLDYYLERYGHEDPVGLPTELRFSQLPPEQPYQGRVRLSVSGWKTIQNLSKSKSSFEIATGRNIGGEPEFLQFRQVEIKENVLTGTFESSGGPAIETIYLEFTAVKN